MCVGEFSIKQRPIIMITSIHVIVSAGSYSKWCNHSSISEVRDIKAFLVSRVFEWGVGELGESR